MLNEAESNTLQTWKRPSFYNDSTSVSLPPSPGPQSPTSSDEITVASQSDRLSPKAGDDGLQARMPTSEWQSLIREVLGSGRQEWTSHDVVEKLLEMYASKFAGSNISSVRT